MPDEGFSFVQFDYPGRIGLPAGRWVVRDGADDEPSHVLIVDRTPQSGPRRKKRIDGEPPAESPNVTRVTVIDATGADGTDHDVRRASATAVVERALTAAALAARDAHAPLVPPPPVGVRVGNGSGEQVAHGRWTEAFELPVSPKVAKRLRPAPSEGRFAELLGGRMPPTACALATLRARADLDAGRLREAALMLDAAIGCAREELAGQIPDARLEALAAHSAASAAVAAEARSGPIGPDARLALEAALERLEAALATFD